MSQAFLIVHHNKGKVYILKDIADTKAGKACIWTSITDHEALSFNTFEEAAEFYRNNIRDRTAAYIFAVET